MPRFSAVLLTAGILFHLSHAAVAEPVPAKAEVEPAPICDAADSEDYLTRTSGQFLRGVVNLAFCWVELLNQPAVAYREGRNVPVGFFKGIGHTLLRGARGLGEALLCWDPRDPASGTFHAPIANDCALGILGLEGR